MTDAELKEKVDERQMCEEAPGVIITAIIIMMMITMLILIIDDMIRQPRPST